jgi:cell division protein FtsB
MKAIERLLNRISTDGTTQAESLPEPVKSSARLRHAVLTGLYLGLGASVLVLGYRLWLDPDHGVKEVADLQARVAAQEAENQRLSARNRALAHDIASFRAGTDAVEERARSELGMIRSGETFVRLIESDEH